MSDIHPFEKFFWFMGVVENTDDLKGVNRVQVRCVHYHTSDRASLPTEELPWATVGQSCVDMSSPMLLRGDWVFGFFLDGANAQQPMIVCKWDGIPDKPDSSIGFSDPSGVYPKTPGKPTTSPLARGDLSANNPITYSRQTITKGIPLASSGTWDEPSSAYAAKYPYNHVIQTDAGNVIEIDDTSGAERIHFFHISGSETEIFPDGTTVVRSLGNSFEIDSKNKNIVVGGNWNLSVVGDLNALASGNVGIGGKNINLNAAESVQIGAQKDVNVYAGGSLIQESESMLSLKTSAVFAVDGSSIAIQNGDSESAEKGNSPATVPSPNVKKYS